MVKDEIKKSVRAYTLDENDAWQKMKLLLEPVDYLNVLRTTKDCLMTMDEFISDQKSLSIYIAHIRNLFLSGYVNYYKGESLPETLYRSISKSEFDYIGKKGEYNTLVSTFKSLDEALAYTLVANDHDWDSLERFVLEFAPQRHPFINVDDFDIPHFEDGEVILMAPYSLSNLKLVRDGGMNALGFYKFDTVPIYKAEFTSKIPMMTVREDELNQKFDVLVHGINRYGKLLSELLIHQSPDMSSEKNFIKWVKNTSQFFRLYSAYLNLLVSKSLDEEEIVEKDVISKRLKQMPR